MLLRLLFAALLLCPAPAAAQTQEAEPLKATYTLGPVQVREKYISMTGPVMTDKVTLAPAAEGPVWVNSFHVAVVDEKGAPESSEYLCHSWVVFGKMQGDDQKMLTISEGLDEMTFPPGFAMRVDHKTQQANLLAQVLNNNEKTDKTLLYKLTLGYFDDAAAKKMALRPLRTLSVGIMGKDANPDGKTSDICRTQDAVDGPVAGQSVVHFDVPPGRHEYHSDVAKDNALYLGGTIHYIKLHLHPYGESVALVDKTAGKALWTGRVKTGDARVILTDVDYYSSSKGIKLDPAHDFEVVSVYNNTTDKLTDAMAVLRIYVSDDAKEQDSTLRPE